MDVAIIGAGVSGLACAHELQRFGINPVIYEKNSFIGDQYTHISALLKIQHRPIKDAIEYFKQKLNINVTPVNTISNLTHFSPHKTSVIKGNFGYFLKRGREEDSLYKQIHSQLDSPNILFSKIGDYEPLTKEFDYVVVANGNAGFTKELGCWQESVKTYIRGAVVLGNFDPNTLIMWINKDFCKNGYAYLTPFNNKKASVILVVTDVNEREVDHYWELFLYSESLKYTIIEEFKQPHDTGFTYPHKINNIYFTGNAGGAIDPFLGFGQLNSMTMGVMAARSIAVGTDYEKLVRKIVKHNRQLYQLRKSFNNADNNMYDVIVSSIGLPGIKHMLYYTNIDIVKSGAFMLKTMSKFKERDKY